MNDLLQSLLHSSNSPIIRLQESKVDVPVFCLFCLCYVTISYLFLGFDIYYIYSHSISSAVRLVYLEGSLVGSPSLFVWCHVAERRFFTAGEEAEEPGHQDGLGLEVVGHSMLHNFGTHRQQYLFSSANISNNSESSKYMGDIFVWSLHYKLH